MEHSPTPGKIKYHKFRWIPLFYGYQCIIKETHKLQEVRKKCFSCNSYEWRIEILRWRIAIAPSLGRKKHTTTLKLLLKANECYVMLTGYPIQKDLRLSTVLHFAAVTVTFLRWSYAPYPLKLDLPMETANHRHAATRASMPSPSLRHTLWLSLDLWKW